MKTLLALITLTFSLLANELQPHPYSIIQAEIGKGKPLFLEVGSTMCTSCKEMGEKLYRIKQENPDYVVYFLNVGDDRDSARALNIRMIPTQIIFDAKGNETYRHIGGLSTDQLKELFKEHHFGMAIAR